MSGFLIPSTYQEAVPTIDDLTIVSLIWGFTLSTGMFAANKAFVQTRTMWKRSRRVQAYGIMVWSEWTSSTLIGILSWCFIRGFIRASFWVYFSLLCLWVVQIQCICGIIINRISLLMKDQRRMGQLRWAVAGFLGLINLSVFIIWIPARLQISAEWMHINEIWDRIEKVLFLLVDAGLNLYFIHLVHTRLISNGLTKYNSLFRFNLFMVAVSMSLDVILIGSMSIPNGLIYVQFHPLVYMLKLYIEMGIADLIVKVVRATDSNVTPSPYSNSRGMGGVAVGNDKGTHNGGNDTELRSRPNLSNMFAPGASSGGARAMLGNNASETGTETIVQSDGCKEGGSGSYGLKSANGGGGGGITKIVRTTISSRAVDPKGDLDDGDASSQSSTKGLQKHAAWGNDDRI